MDKHKLILILGVAALALSIAGTQWYSTRGVPDGDQVIEMVAADFRFTPHEVRVRAGSKVTLKVRATDDKHGISFKLIATGQPEGSPSGLRFLTPLPKSTPDWVLEKGQEQTIEFVAERRGHYEFACSVFCGMGHNEMLGRIIVQ